MPRSVSILNTISLRSSEISSDGNPSWAIPPPWAIAPIAARSADALPDISRATSKPSTMPSVAPTSRRSTLPGIDGDRGAHPKREVASVGVRFADDDVTGARVAHDRGRHEADRAGPAHEDVLAEDREGERGVDRVAERVEDRGDLGVDARPWCQMLVIGRATYWANAPSRPTPRPIVLAHRWRLPARQWRQRPQTTWPSPDDEVARVEVHDVRPDLDDLADELVADDERRVDRRLRPVVP